MRPSWCGGAALCLNAPAFYRLLVYSILMLASCKTLILLILKAQGAPRTASRNKRQAPRNEAVLQPHRSRCQL